MYRLVQLLRVVAEEEATEEVMLTTILSNLFQADAALREFHTRRAFFLTGGEWPLTLRSFIRLARPNRAVEMARGAWYTVGGSVFGYRSLL